MVTTNSTIARIIRDVILSRPLQAGTWKFFHPNAKTPVDCPYGTISCVGSHATSINYTTSLVQQLINGNDIGRLTDESYCSEHFSGALCSQSSSGYYIDWTSHQSLACQESASSSLFRSLMLCLPLALLLPIVICFTVGRKYKKENKKSDDISPSKIPSLVRWLLSYEAEKDLSTTTQILEDTGLFGSRVLSSRSEQPRIQSLQSRPSEMNMEDLYNNKDEDSMSSNSNHTSSRVVLRQVDNTSVADSNSTCGSIHSMQSTSHVIISKRNRSVYEATLLKLQSELIANELTFNDMVPLPPDALPAKEGTVAFPPESAQWREIHFQQARRSYRAMGYLFKVKIFTTSLQLIASLPSSVGMSYLPPITASLLRICSNISLVSLQAIPTDCIGSLLGYRRADMVLLMQIASSVPLLVLALLLAGYLLQTEIAHLNGLVGRYYRDNLHRLSLRYSTVAWMMVIVLVAGVGQLALKCFTCVDIDPDHIFSAGTQVLWNDPSILCSDSNYSIGVVWATTASFTYILGVPLVMWVALRYSGHNLFTGSNVLHDNTSTATVTATETAADNDSVASNSNGNINAAGISRRHDRYVDSAWGLDLTPRMYLSNNFALLNLSYRSSFVYWEILETCFRLLLIAVLPYFRQQLRPLQLLFGAGLISLAYLWALWWCRPYNNAMNQNLALSGICQVLCLVLGLLMIEVVGEDSMAESEVYFDLSMCVVVLAMPLLLLYQLLRAAYMSLRGISNPKYNTTIDLQFVPRDTTTVHQSDDNGMSDMELGHADVSQFLRDDRKELDMRAVRDSINSRRPKMIGNRTVATRPNNLLFAVGGRYYKNNDVLKVLNINDDDDDDDDDDGEDDDSDAEDEDRDRIDMEDGSEEEWEDEEITEEKDDASHPAPIPSSTARKCRNRRARNWSEEDVKSDLSESFDDEPKRDSNRRSPSAINCTAPPTSNETTPERNILTVPANYTYNDNGGSPSARKVVSQLALRLRQLSETSSEDDDENDDGRRSKGSRRDRQQRRSPRKVPSISSQKKQANSRKKAPLSPSLFAIIQS